MYNLKIKNNLALIKLKNIPEDNYSYNANSFTEWLQNTGNDLDYNSIYQYFNYINQQGYKPKTIAIKRAAVIKRIKQIYKKEIFEIRYRVDFMLREISEEIKCPKDYCNYIENKDIVSKKDYELLLKKCNSERQKSYVMFLFKTGIRINELTNIKIKDCIRHEDCVIIRINGKFKKLREIRIDYQLYEYINDTFKGKVYLFETEKNLKTNNNYISSQIKVIGKRINLKISAHSLRHSFATNMINDNPGKLESISKYLGHQSSSATIDHYIHTKLTNEELFN